MQALARQGFAVEVLCGSMLDLDTEADPAAWLATRGLTHEMVGGESLTLDMAGVRADVPPHLRLTVRGVPITVHRAPTMHHRGPTADERKEFLKLFEETLSRFRPDVLVTTP